MAPLTRTVDGESCSYLTTPPSCPEAGHWETPIRFWWADGFVDTVVTRQPCTPGSAKAARRSLGSRVVPIRVVLADDSVAMRDVMAEMLGRSPDIVVVATADDDPTLLAAVDECRPDVVVTDVRMPPTGTDEGVRVAAHLATAQPHIGVVIVSQYSEPGWLSRVFDLGSENRGWVMKERAHTGGQLISAVKAVHQGDRWIDASVMASE